jgi:hypothetical protein
MKTLHFQNVARGTKRRVSPIVDMMTEDPAAAKDKFPIKIELDVEKKIQAEAYKHRIRIKEFFHDFDKLRKGVVSEAHVTS